MSWVRVWLHIVFTTKNREPILSSKIRKNIFQHIVVSNTIILIHGFIKKSKKTPKPDIELARKRLSNLRSKK